MRALPSSLKRYCPGSLRYVRHAPRHGKRIVGRPHRRESIGLAVVALPCLVYAMDLTVLNLALPVLEP
ncbi:hypothetical protein AB6G26_22435 [Providencia hangzhouensis]|uniref:hypothetical protein n=1 Tax=Providencia hangzhouensis TaxID=3031799 RepID=UPI0034DD7B26